MPSEHDEQMEQNIGLSEAALAQLTEDELQTVGRYLVVYGSMGSTPTIADQLAAIVVRLARALAEKS